MIEAVRDDPVAAAACGLSLIRVRIAAFVIGAAMAGLAGGVLAFFIGFVGPSDFNVQQSLLIFEMAILGGLGSIWGSVAGRPSSSACPRCCASCSPTVWACSA